MERKELTTMFHKYKSDMEIFHDLMPYKVKEVLLVATIYDSYILEQDGRLTEKIFGEYSQLNLTTAPRISSVYDGVEALERMRKKHFDMVVLTMRIDGMTPFELANKIRKENKNIPIVLLLNDETDIDLLPEKQLEESEIDEYFLWNGDPKIFLAMIKFVEDSLNVAADTKIGLVRVILLVEDSIRYYSRYLPSLYVSVIKQTQRLITEEHLDQSKKVMKMRARPKILMAKTYEDAYKLFERYKDYLLCLISDVRFPKDGKVDPEAGFKLIRSIQGSQLYIPTLLQSSNEANRGKAADLGSVFIYKNSDTLSQELMEFFSSNLGFGDFVFRDKFDKEIGRARTMHQFQKALATLPVESLLLHASRNHFSTWFMARGEIQAAKMVKPLKIDDFETIDELRQHMMDVTKKIHIERTKGRVINFDQAIIAHEEHILRLSSGSLGGKGRGLAFLNTLIQNTDLVKKFKNVTIKIPRTAIIGTDEFESFISNINISEMLKMVKEEDEIKRLFLAAPLSKALKLKLKKYLQEMNGPIAVRSSSLFEDSLSQPFSGIYTTFLLPNNGSDKEKLDKLYSAVKLVFASVFSKQARSYFDAISYNIEEERMAVIIQEVVGDRFDDRFYPHFSGVAQSYNFYPVSYLKPTDGLAVIGVGLGKYVIEGERSFQFSPKRPKTDILSPEEQLKDSQDHFYAIDMKKKKLDLYKGEDATLVKVKLNQAEDDGALACCVSVWDNQYSKMKLGLENTGPRVANFAYILKYDYFPLAQVLSTILDLGSYAMGTPIELEYAVNLNEDSPNPPIFYLLQIKPLIANIDEYSVDLENLDMDRAVLYTERSMGNGRMTDMTDIIFVNPDRFDKSKTLEMAREIEEMNHKMGAEGRKYVLIGPGRWGTRDRWLGIPVTWPQISNARVIVEAGIEQLNADASLGTHFFHNITSKNIGYLTVRYHSDKEFLKWDWLKEQPVVERTKYFDHIRLEEPFELLIDGRKGVSLLLI